MRERRPFREMPFCWKRYGLYGVDKESDPAGFATKHCEFRVGDGIMTRERFYCDHPEGVEEGRESDVTKFCEHYKLRAKK